MTDTTTNEPEEETTEEALNTDDLVVRVMPKVKYIVAANTKDLEAQVNGWIEVHHDTNSLKELRTWSTSEGYTAQLVYVEEPKEDA